MDIIKGFIKPELLIIVPVLYTLGMVIKKSKVITDDRIPLIIGMVGIILATIYDVSTSHLTDLRSLLMCIFVGITQGILCAGLTVYGNQLFVVQHKQRKNNYYTEENERRKIKERIIYYEDDEIDKQELSNNENSDNENSKNEKSEV